MNEQTLFLQALDQPPGEARQKWLESECRDLNQRNRIAKLLEQHESAGSFLEHPPAALQRPAQEIRGDFDAPNLIKPECGDPSEKAESQFKFGSKPEKAITKTKFIDRLIRSNLMTKEEVAECEAGIESARTAKDAGSYAQALVEAKILTSFQAKAISEARIKGLTFGEYIILDQLGKGGMGIVYRAKHRRMDRLVAIKVLPRFAMATKGLVGRFYREVKAAGKLMHANIVAALDASEDDGLHYLVMEYVDGQDLGKVLRYSGPLEIDRAVDYVIQAARGLQYAHEQGVIHRDIKPANLLVDPNGVVKILDMGLARLTGAVGQDLEVGHDASSASYSPALSSNTTDPATPRTWESDTSTVKEETRLTKAGEVMGTLDYMSPEQFFDPRSVGERGDIYSLGCTLYRLLTNQRPFPVDSIGAIYDAHCNNPIPKLSAIRSDVPPPLESVFQRMLAKDPEQRQSSMSEVIAELTAATKPISSGFESSHALSGPTQKRRLQRKLKKRILPVGWIAIGSVATALLIVYLLSLTQFTPNTQTLVASGDDQSLEANESSDPVTDKAKDIDPAEDVTRPTPQDATPLNANADTATSNVKPPLAFNPGEATNATNRQTTAENQTKPTDPPKAPVHSEKSPSEKIPPENVDSDAINQQWNGEMFSWSERMNQGMAIPLRNRVFNFSDNGRAVSVSIENERITVTVDGKAVEAANSAELKRKDLGAFKLYEKVFGMHGVGRMPSANVLEQQRERLESLMKRFPNNPQMKSLLERMLPPKK